MALGSRRCVPISRNSARACLELGIQLREQVVLVVLFLWGYLQGEGRFLIASLPRPKHDIMLTRISQPGE